MRVQKIVNRILQWFTTNWRTTHFVFIILALIFGIFFAVKVPIGYTHDESVHAFRAYQLQAGQFFSVPVVTQEVNGKKITLHGGEVATNLVTLEQLTSAGSRHEALCINKVCHQPSEEVQHEVNAAAAQPIKPDEKTTLHTWGASYYFFFSYIPAAIGMQIAQLFNTPVSGLVYGARIGSVLAFTIICGFALYLLRKSKARFIVFTVALLPLSIALAAGLGVDMMLIALSLLLFSLYIRAFQEKEQFSPKLRILMFATALIIPMLKFPYLPLSLAVCTLPIYKQNTKGWIIRLVTIGIVLLPAVLWNFFTADLVRAQAELNSTPGVLVSTTAQLSFILHNPFEFIWILLKSIFTQNWLEYIGGVTQQGVPFPPLLYYFEIIPMLFAAYITAVATSVKVRQGKLMAGVIFGGAILAFLAIFISLYVSYTPVGNAIILGVQGRYLIPLIPFLVFGLALCFKLRPIPEKWQKDYYIYAVQFGILLTAAVWYYCKVYIWV